MTSDPGYCVESKSMDDLALRYPYLVSFPLLRKETLYKIEKPNSDELGLSLSSPKLCRSPLHNSDELFPKLSPATVTRSLALFSRWDELVEDITLRKIVDADEDSIFIGFPLLNLP